MQHLIFLFALIVMTFSRVSLAEEKPAIVLQEEAIVYEALMNDLKVLTKTLTRDVAVYSWTSKKKLISNFTLPKSDSIEFNHPAYRQYALSKLNKFFTYKGQGLAAAWLGNGLYTYHNPIGSRSYGSTLIEVIIPKGNAYLDLRNGTHKMGKVSTDREIKLSKPTIKALNKLFSCGKLKSRSRVGRFNGVSFYALSKNKFMKCAPRAAMLKRAFAELNIAFVAYVWSAGDKKTKYCPNSNADSTAHVINAGPWMKNAIINGYIKKFSNDFGDEHLQAYRSIHMFTKVLRKGSPKWKFFKEMDITEFGISKIKNKFGCGQYPEDKLTKD